MRLLLSYLRRYWRLVALALTGAKRSPQLPEVPTFAESGLRGMDAGLWFVLLAPAATPREIVARLNAEVLKLGAAPDYRAQLEKVGFEPFTGSPEQSGKCQVLNLVYSSFKTLVNSRE